MFVLTEYSGGKVCGIFDSLEEVYNYFEGREEHNSSLRNPKWFPHEGSLVLLHRYEANGGQWLARWRLTEMKKNRRRSRLKGQSVWEQKSLDTQIVGEANVSK
jgi:hypothetical protein